jgi:regulator of protease activity HflC (stomatin/prohibitin superfamily)
MHDMHMHWMGSGVFGAQPLARGRRIVVNEWERAVLMKDGAIVETLGSGAHRRWGRGYVLHRVDVRPWVLHVPVQEIPTADGVTVKLTAAAVVRVADAVAWFIASRNAVEQLYLRVQVALRDLVATATVDDVVAGRAAAHERLVAALGDTEPIGLAVERIEIRDVILPTELKRAQADVLLARAEGQASLERARGEAAALRTLANAARLANDVPALVDLRLVQELGRSSGHTIAVPFGRWASTSTDAR